jgi:hypothetical protein
METHFHDKIEGNRGVIMGTAYGTKENAFNLTGSRTTVSTRGLPKNIEHDLTILALPWHER